MYDAAGRAVAAVNALGNRTTTMFDAVGNTQTLIDARGNRHSFLYDAADREVALIDPLSRRTTSGYDAAGNQTLRIDARGNRTTYAFDAASQLTSRRYPDGSRVTFAWDENGNRALMADGTGRYTWLYDALNRTSENRQPNSKTITYTWDAVGNKAGMIDPDGGRFTYNYDPASRLSLLENPWNERTTFNYDSTGRRTVKKLANATRASFSYDAADRVKTVANMDSTAAYISRYDYEYDNADNRTAVLEADGSRVTWSYDAANQLLAENRTGTTPYVNTFSYDAAQNRLTKNESGALTTYSYDAANQLETSLDAGGTTTYTFDPNGNQQIVESPGGGRTTTTWDYENQPTKTVLPSGIVNTATYNGDNLRKELQDSEGTKRFVWDGTQYLLQTDGSNATEAVWTSEPAEFTTLFSQRRDSATQYPHFDALGSTRQLTDAAETVMDTWLYDAWGNVLARTGTTYIPLQFVGMYGYFADSDTGAAYVVMRNYGTTSGLWWSADPLSQILEFNYVDNSPLNAIDPLGLLLVAVDGTNSQRWLQSAVLTSTGLWQSHVRNFYDAYTAAAAYWHGPGITGQAGRGIRAGAHAWVCRQWCASTCALPIDLIGHSRGGHIVLEVARWLNDRGCVCGQWRYRPVRVRFLGMYDPVDMTAFFGAESIPANVVYAVNYLAAPTTRTVTRSRRTWNRVDGRVEGAMTTYVRRFVTATHSGIGGAPWAGDHPRGHTERNDIRQSISVDRNMRTLAVRQGVPLRRIPTPRQYGYYIGLWRRRR